MKEIKVLPVDERMWLPVEYGNRVIKFAYPPVQGTHEHCFETLTGNKEIRPAEGIELGLLARQVFVSSQEQWKNIRENCWFSSYTRIPIRNLWVPAKTFEGDNYLAGVLVERDTVGRGLSEEMLVPELPDLADSSQWKQNAEGIYVHQKTDAKFIPSDKYKLGKQTAKSFAENKYAQAMLTPEGAEVFAKAAVHGGYITSVSGLDVNIIDRPEKKVSVMGCSVTRKKLCLDGGQIVYGIEGGTGLYAFGVSVEGEQ